MICLTDGVSELAVRKLRTACRETSLFVCNATLNREVVTGGQRVLARDDSRNGQYHANRLELCNFNTFGGLALPILTRYYEYFRKQDIIQYLPDDDSRTTPDKHYFDTNGGSVRLTHKNVSTRLVS